MRSAPALPGLLALLLLLACGEAPPAAERAIPAELPAEAREAARRLLFGGAANLRDLGGYPGTDGRSVRWGLLYRSEALDELDAEDVAYLERLGVRRVVDFRSEVERERDPDRLPEGLEVVWQPIAGEGLDPAELGERLRAGDVDAARAERWLVEANRAFVTGFAGVYGRFLRDLAEPGNLPTLFHCTAGKDRAGFAAALVLLALDVPRDVVMRDYLLTNEYSAAKTRRLLRLIRWISFFRVDPEAIRPLFEAREGYLSAAFEAIDREYGSTDAYLREALGVDAALRARLRAALLEAPSEASPSESSPAVRGSGTGVVRVQAKPPVEPGPARQYVNATSR